MRSPTDSACSPSTMKSSVEQVEIAFPQQPAASQPFSVNEQLVQVAGVHQVYMKSLPYNACTFPLTKSCNEQAFMRSLPDSACGSPLSESCVEQVKAAGPPAADDMTIAAQLMRCKDPATNKPLTDGQLLPMASMFFWAGWPS